MSGSGEPRSQQADRSHQNEQSDGKKVVELLPAAKAPQTCLPLQCGIP